jgi:hypothetical protein
MARKRKLNTDSIQDYEARQLYGSTQTHTSHKKPAPKLEPKPEPKPELETESSVHYPALQPEEIPFSFAPVTGASYLDTKIAQQQETRQLVAAEPVRRGHRWYDFVENMADAVDFIKHAPASVQKMFVEHIIQEFKKHKDEIKKQRDPVSAGSDKLKHIYFSQMHQRWQDKDPTLRRMFVLLTTFPESFLMDFSERVLMTQELVQNAALYGRTLDYRQIEKYLKKPYSRSSR